MSIYFTQHGHRGLHPEPSGLYINIPRGVPVALFLTNSLNLRDSSTVKTKAFSYAFLYVCAMPAFHPSGFCNGYDRPKYKKIEITLSIAYKYVFSFSNDFRRLGVGVAIIEHNVIIFNLCFLMLFLACRHKSSRARTLYI